MDKIKLLITIACALALLLFIIFNSEHVMVDLVFMHMVMPLFVLILISALLGSAATIAARWWWSSRRTGKGT